MALGKRERHFERVAEFKERFRMLPTETIRRRLNIGMLQKEAAIALRELLEERESEARSQLDQAADAFYEAADVKPSSENPF